MFWPDNSANIDVRLRLPNKLEKQSTRQTMFSILPYKTLSARLIKRLDTCIFVKQSYLLAQQDGLFKNG